MGWRTRKHLKRTGIAGSERGRGRVLSDEESRGNGKRGRRRGREVMMGRGGWEKGGLSEKIGRKRGGSLERVSKKLRRKSELRTIDSLSRRDVGIFSRGSTETEEDPGKVVEPVRGGGACSESSFEAAVETLNQTIGLRVIGSSGLVSDIEETAKMKPKGGCELRAAVRGDDRRNTKTRDPGMNKGGSTISGSGGGKWYSFRPARGAVNDSEEIGITGRRRERANQINMNVGKSVGRDRDMLGRNFGMAVNFSSLAGQAGSTPGSDITGKVWPDITRGNKAAGGTNTRMGQVVNVMKDLFTESERNEGAEVASGDVAVERQIT